MIKTLKKKLIYENAWIRLWEDNVAFSNGDQGIYAYTDRVDAGPMIIPITDDGKVMVLKEWRYPVQSWVYCFPCGGSEPGEDMLTAAKRELQEETGCVAEHWAGLGSLAVDPGGSSQIAQIFLARGLTVRTPDEKYEMFCFSLSEIEQMIESGEITSSWMLAGFAKLRAFLSRSEN